MFFFLICILNPLTATFQLSSAASLNLGWSQNGVLGNGLTYFHTILHFDALKLYIAVENIVRKGEIACNKQFLLVSQYILAYMVLIFHFQCTLKCRLQFVSVWTSLKFCRLVMGVKQTNLRYLDRMVFRLPVNLQKKKSIDLCQSVPIRWILSACTLSTFYTVLGSHLPYIGFNVKIHCMLTLSQTTYFRLIQTERVCRQQFQIG